MKLPLKCHLNRNSRSRPESPLADAHRGGKTDRPAPADHTLLARLATRKLPPDCCDNQTIRDVGDWANAPDTVAATIPTAIAARFQLMMTSNADRFTATVSFPRPHGLLWFGLSKRRDRAISILNRAVAVSAICSSDVAGWPRGWNGASAGPCRRREHRSHQPNQCSSTFLSCRAPSIGYSRSAGEDKDDERYSSSEYTPQTTASTREATKNPP